MYFQKQKNIWDKIYKHLGKSTAELGKKNYTVTPKNLTVSEFIKNHAAEKRVKEIIILSFKMQWGGC